MSVLKERPLCPKGAFVAFRLAVTLLLAAGCRSRHTPPAQGAAHSSAGLPTILANLPLDSAVRATFPSSPGGVPPSVTGGAGGVPPERQFEALYTLEFQTPVSETEVVDWLDAVTRELLRRRGAWVTTSMRYDNGLRTFWFHTPTTVGWVSIVARKRREDGSMPFIAAAVETPRRDLRPRARR